MLNLVEKKHTSLCSYILRYNNFCKIKFGKFTKILSSPSKTEGGDIFLMKKSTFAFWVYSSYWTF